MTMFACDIHDNRFVTRLSRLRNAAARFPLSLLELGMRIDIQFLVYPGNWPEHLMWGSILAYVLTRGDGALSINRIVAFNLFGRT
jgi:hypothetical protein